MLTSRAHALNQSYETPLMERGRLSLGFSREKLAAVSAFHRISLLRRSIACLLILAQLGFVGGAAAKPQEPEKPLHDWATANDLWLQAQITPNDLVPAPEPSRRGLLLSYALPREQFPQIFHRSAIYDDALAALAFLTTGDRERAASTLDAVARLVRPDGSLWFSYNTGDDWPSEDDHESSLVRTGAVAWVGYAFTFYLKHAPPCAGDPGCARERAFFSATAVRLAKYLLTLQVNAQSDPRDGLLRLGYGTINLAYSAKAKDIVELYLDQPATGISTENNISAWFFLRQLAEVTGDAVWRRATERIQLGLLNHLWSDALGQFNEGFASNGSLDSIKALDCASWGALFLLATGERDKAQRALEVTHKYYATQEGDAIGYGPYSDSPVYENAEVGRFFFPDDPHKQWRSLPIVWSEGTLGVALAWLHLGQAERARQLVMGLRPLSENTGLRCATLELPFQMADVPCVAASAWLVLVVAALSHNPLAEQMWK
jgi:hypothetical protein